MALLPALPVLAAAPPAPTALPTGGQVVAEQASIQQNAPASLTIPQSTQRAAIDGQSFNIGAAASAKFVQPSSQSGTLNRVLDGNPLPAWMHFKSGDHALSASTCPMPPS